jgi:hypothetical protein
MGDVSCPCDTCPKVKCDERHLSYFGRAKSKCQAWRDYIKNCEARNTRKELLHDFKVKTNCFPFFVEERLCLKELKKKNSR